MEPVSLSVITVFHQRRDLCRGYLRAWNFEPRKTELVFGDNASTDGTGDLLRRCSHPRTRMVEFHENLGYARANNLLAARSSGEILLFLNYDVAFLPRWLNALIEPFAQRPKLGIVGNVQLSVRTQAPDHAGIFFDHDGTPRHFRPTLKQLAGLDLLPVPAVTGACLAIRRDVFEAVGGFHEGYRNSYEDIELCIQARRLGYEVAVATNSIIWHYIGASPGRQTREAANAALFESRCGDLARSLSRFRPPDLDSGDRTRLPTADPAQYNGSLQVYFDRGAGFSEQDSTVHLYHRGQWNRIEIALAGPNQPAPTVVRLDPSGSLGRIRLGGIAVKHGPHRSSVGMVRGRELPSIARIAGTARLIDDPRCMSVEITGEDPQVMFRLDAISRTIPEGAVLDLWLWADRSTERVSTAIGAKLPGPKWPLWPRPRRILADLSRLSPGGLNGGVKIFVLEMLNAIARRHRFRLKIGIVASAAVCTEIARIAPSLQCHPAKDCNDPKVQAAVAKADVLYAPIGYSKLSRPDLPQVTLIVDVLHRDVVGALPELEVAIREKWFVESICQSRVLQCMSRFVVERLRHHYGTPPASTLVIYSAGGTRKRPRRQPSDPTPYFFYPANDWPHKNHENLIAAYAEYRRQHPAAPWELKLSGHFSDPERVIATVHRLGLSQWVEVLGYLPEERFTITFANAGALVFPSLYEGFGIPVLEAFRLEVPVICSNAGSLPEVGENACGYFDPRNTDSIRAAMTRIATDVGWRKSLVAAGQRRAKDFILSNEADKLARAFIDVAHQR